jgi:hypothetical protein
VTEETGGSFVFVDADGFLSGPPDEVPPQTVRSDCATIRSGLSIGSTR